MSLISFLKGCFLTGLVAFGIALGLAWEHRAHTPGWIRWAAGRSLAEQVAALNASIDAPLTGWDARFRQCEANGKALEAAMQTQGAALAALSTESGKMVTESKKAVTEALRVAQGAKEAVAEIAARTPASSDVCASAYQLIRDYAR
jgi:hypothetical protein